MASPDDTVEAKANKALAERITRVRVVVDEAFATLAAPLHVGSNLTEDGETLDLRPTLRFLSMARNAGSQREVLSALLDVASTCYARAVLFISRSGALVAWETRKIGTASEGSRKVLHLTLPLRGDHLAARAVSSGDIVIAGPEGPGTLMTGPLGGFVPARSAAVPLVVRGRSVAVLYGDCGRSGASGSESLFALIGPIGGLCIEALGSGRRGRAADAQRGEAHTVATGGGPERRAVLAGAPSHRGDASADFDAIAPGLDDLAPTMEQEISATTPQAPEEAEMQALLGEIDEMRRGPADAAPGPEERRADADAHRLASLLISELLLYNEEAVILGRRHRDLSSRLAREIEKSRQTYVARVPGPLHGAGRYFDEELVRVLAEGDPSVLGG